ncbi:MAG: addiction module protein [Victivallales bacterium]
MIAALSLDKMTIPDKISTMELLWDDICHNAPDFSSPTWHGDILKERERGLKQGKDKFIDWKEAKKDILDSVS